MGYNIHTKKAAVNMERTVYIDLLFLINFSMDFLCFYISSKIISARFSALRAVAASVVGGAYSGAALFISAGPVLSVAIDVLVCFFMCLIVFGGKRVGVIFSTLVYFSVSMALGGFMTALFNLLNRMGFSSLAGENAEGDGISVWLFALLAVVSGVFTLIGGRFFRRRSSQKSVTVLIRCGRKEKRLSAMVDSGNFLREPISGRACIAVEAQSLCGLVPDEVLAAAREERAFSSELVSDTFAKRLRVVPAHTAAGERLLIGVRADSVRIDAGKGAYESDAYIVLSRLDAPLGAEALVPSELLN